MENFKGILASRTIWALLFAGLAQVLNLAGYEFGFEEQAKAVDLAINIATLVSVAAGMFYRVKATKVIGKPPVE